MWHKEIPLRKIRKNGKKTSKRNKYCNEIVSWLKCKKSKHKNDSTNLRSKLVAQKNVTPYVLQYSTDGLSTGLTVFDYLLELCAQLRAAGKQLARGGREV